MNDSYANISINNSWASFGNNLIVAISAHDVDSKLLNIKLWENWYFIMSQ